MSVLRVFFVDFLMNKGVIVYT